MNPMLQRHCAKFIYIVPDGLREIMSDISREVIRTQPEQIYTFIADYLDALMITRENARIAVRLVDTICEIAETTVELLVGIGISRSEANAIVAVIQQAFREYLETKKKCLQISEEPGEFGEEEDVTMKILKQLDITPEKLEETVIIIQNAWRKFKERQEREKEMLFGMVDWRIAARSAILLYKKTGVSIYEANRAATLIKAAYKGYYTRRIMRRLLRMGTDEQTDQMESTVSADIDLGSIQSELQYLGPMDNFDESGSTITEDFLFGENDTEQTPHTHHTYHTSHRDQHTVTPTTGTVTGKAIATPTPATGHTDGQVTDDGQTLPIDGLSPEDDFSQIHSVRGEGGTHSFNSHRGGDSSENKVQPPPNTEQDEVTETAETELTMDADGKENAQEPTEEPIGEPVSDDNATPEGPGSEPVTDDETGVTATTTTGDSSGPDD